MEKLELHELSDHEINTIEGGIFGIDDVIVGVVVGAVVSIIRDWDNFKAGLFGDPPIK